MADISAPDTQAATPIPIFKVIAESVKIPFRHPKKIFYSTFLVSLPIIFFTIYMILAEYFPDILFGSYGDIFIAVTVTIILFALVYLLAGIFNYWIRISLLMSKTAIKQTFRDRMRQTRITLCYFVVIFLCLTVISFLIDLTSYYVGFEHTAPEISAIFNLSDADLYKPLALAKELVFLFFYCPMIILVSERLVRIALYKQYLEKNKIQKFSRQNFWRAVVIIFCIEILFEIILYILTFLFNYIELLLPIEGELLVIILTMFFLILYTATICVVLANIFRHRTNFVPVPTPN